MAQASIQAATLRVLRVPYIAVVPALALAAVACNSSKASVTTAPSPVKCQVAVVMAQSTMPASGGQSSLNVTAAPECSWTASTTASWITNLSPTSGQGDGVVGFRVEANTSASPRSGQIVLNGINVALAQSGASCQYSISPKTQSFGTGSFTGAIVVTAPAECSWTAVSNATWLTVTSGASGNGGGTVEFAASANTGATRVGNITIGDQVYAATQEGTCVLTLTPSSQSVGVTGGAASFSVTTATGCTWTASTAETWITLPNPAPSGNGNGVVNFTVAANTGAARTGRITVAGQTHTVSQAGSCAATLNPSSQTVAAGGGNATPIEVAVATGCTWTATTADAWIVLPNPAPSGNGAGVVSFAAAANTGPARTGSIAIAGRTHTVTQASGCTYALDSTSASFSSAAGSGGPVAVTAGTGCTWTAVSNAAWITVVTGATGTGNGTVTFTVEANATGSPRTGTITIAGLTFTVSQAFPFDE
jgi:hypothetical protein